MAIAPWRAHEGGLKLTVRVTPRGGRDELSGIRELPNGRSAIEARVRAAASEGEANRAVLRLVATRLELPQSAVTLASGTTSRIKILAIAGDAGAIVARLEQLQAKG